MKINRGSSIKFNKQLNIIIIAAALGLPSVLMVLFNTCPAILKILPSKIILIYSLAYTRLSKLAPNIINISSQNIKPTKVRIPPNNIDKDSEFPIINSALFLSPFPNFIEILAVAPTPNNILKAIKIVVKGSVTPIPVIAIAPISFIFPINILSTTLYNALTSIPIIEGIEYFISSFIIDSFSKSSSS